MFSKLLAEFIGTFWLVLGGCGSTVLAATCPELGIGLTGVSLAFGLTVLTAAYALGPAAAARLRQRRDNRQNLGRADGMTFPLDIVKDNASSACYGLTCRASSHPDTAYAS